MPPPPASSRPSTWSRISSGWVTQCASAGRISAEPPARWTASTYERGSTCAGSSHAPHRARSIGEGMPITGRVTHVTVVRAYDRAMAVLVALLLVALVGCGALAFRLHTKNAECVRREAEAQARARETMLVATVARRLLKGGAIAPQLGWIGTHVGEALGARSARIEFGSVPAPREGERSVRLELEGRSALVYGAGGLAWPLERMRRSASLCAEGGAGPVCAAEPLARLIAVALERERLAAKE